MKTALAIGLLLLVGCRGNTSDSAFPPLWKLAFYPVRAVFAGKPKPEPTASQLLMQRLAARDNEIVDLAAVGKDLVGRYGIEAARKAVIDSWTQQTRGESTSKAGDVIWLQEQKPRVRDLAWLLQYQTEWLPQGKEPL